MAAKAVYHRGTYAELLNKRKPKVKGWLLTREEYAKAADDSVRTQVIVSDELLNDLVKCLLELKYVGRCTVLRELLKHLHENDMARLAYLAGLIDKATMQDLHCIHNIRNCWAHIKRPKLADDSKLKKNVKKLSTVGKKKVTERNYMVSCLDAVTKCSGILLTTLEEFEEEQKIS